MAEATVNSVQFTLAYEDTDFTRNMKLTNVSDSVLENVKTKIQAINASLAGGTATGLSEFFVSDDGDSFKQIISAKIESVVTTPINLGGA